MAKKKTIMASPKAVAMKYSDYPEASLFASRTITIIKSQLDPNSEVQHGTHEQVPHSRRTELQLELSPG